MDILLGHGRHHIDGYEIYNNKLIIYGLGDFTGDFKFMEKYNTDDSLILLYDTKTNSIIEKRKVKGKYIPYTFNNKKKCKTYNI